MTKQLTSYSEKLVKHWMRTEGYWYMNYGVITDMVMLHEYFPRYEKFMFLVELAYELELGVETIVQWAEEVRQENFPEPEIKEGEE